MNGPDARPIASGTWPPAPDSDLADPAHGLFPSSRSGSGALPPLQPVRFAAWQATCRSFGAAFAAGPGLVALVGPAGSGKTYTFMAFAAGAAGLPVAIRSAGDALAPGIEADLVDNAGTADLPALTDLRGFAGARALAIPPSLVGPLQKACPPVRIVYVKPMSSRDVRILVEERREQLAMPPGSLTLKAIARLDELCRGNPRRLDELLLGAYRLFTADGAIRIAVDHVDEAADQVQSETMARQAGLSFRGRAFEADPLPRDGPPVSQDLPFVPPHQHAAGSLVASPHPAPHAPAGLARVAEQPQAPPRQRPARRVAIGATAAACAAVALIAFLAIGLPTQPAQPQANAGQPAPEPTRSRAIAPPASDPTLLAANTPTPPLPPPPMPTPVTPPPPLPAPVTTAPPEPATLAETPPGKPAPPTAPAPDPRPPEPALAPPPDPPVTLAASEPDTAPAAPAEPGTPAPPRPGARARGTPAEAARLLSIARTMLSIGQVADAMHLAKAAADMGSKEAASLIAARQPPPAPARVPINAVPQRQDRPAPPLPRKPQTPNPSP